MAELKKDVVFLNKERGSKNTLAITKIHWFHQYFRGLFTVREILPPRLSTFPIHSVFQDALSTIVIKKRFEEEKR